MSAPFYLAESLHDQDALAGDPPTIPTDPGTDQFKTVRGWFRSREAVEAAIAEQAEFGWTLYEVIDGFRIRFRRTAQAAAKDVARIGNPYATTCRNHAPVPVAFFMILGLPILFAVLMVVCLFAMRQSAQLPLPTTAAEAAATATVDGARARRIAIPTPPRPPAVARQIIIRGE